MAFDSNYSNVVLLLKFEGDNNSTTFVDSGPNAVAVGVSGDAKITTTQSARDGSSLALDGSLDYLTFSSNYLSGYAGDVTIETFFKLAALPTGNAYNTSFYVFGFGPNNSDQGVDFYIGNTQIRFNHYAYGTNILSGSWAPDTTTWHHLAVVRSGNSWAMYLDGVSIATATNSNAFVTYAGTAQIGICEGQSGGANAGSFNGYMDNFRITKAARYTSSFSPTGIAYDPYGVVTTAPSFAVSAYTGPQANVSAPPAVVYGGELRSATIAISAPAPQVTFNSGAVIAVTLPSPTVSSAVHSSYGDNALIFTAPSFSLSSFGGGNAAAALPMPTVSFTATGTALANVDVVAPAATVQSTGTVSAVAQVDAAVPMATLIGYGGAVCSVTAPGMPAVEVTGTAGGVASAAVTLPMFDVVADGTAQNYGSLIAAAPMPGMLTGLQAYVLAPMATLVASGTATVTATYEAYAMNMKHAPRPRGQEDAAPVNEVTRYTNFPFTHIVRHKNSYYGVNSSGLYLLEGTTDNGTAIPYEARTHISDLDEIKLKTVVSAYFGGRLGAASTVTLYAGESTVEAYAFTTPRGAVAQNYRQKFGRGLKTRYFALGASGSAEFSIDNVAFEVATMTRRV